MSKPESPEVLFEDPHLIVLAKPAGLLSQGEITGDENLVDWLRVRWDRPYVGLVHRLDRNTSGILVVAKRTKSANRLTESLQKGELHRSYLAWVNGALAAPKYWTHHLRKDERTNVVRVVAAGSAGAKEASLNARPITSSAWKGNPITLIELILETGRSHQIRVQAAFEGFPLLGDLKYRNRFSGSASDSFGRPALHSHRLVFPHPMSGEKMAFEAPLPADMATLATSGFKSGAG